MQLLLSDNGSPFLWFMDEIRLWIFEVYLKPVRALTSEGANFTISCYSKHRWLLMSFLSTESEGLPAK